MSGGLESAFVVAAVAIVPLVVLMLTSFVKISVVLSLLRNALGAPDVPSGLVVMGLSLILTFFVMMPVAIEVVEAATETAPGPRGSGPRGFAPPPRGSPAPDPSAPDPSAPDPSTPGSPAGTQPGTQPGPPAPHDLERAIRKLVPREYQSQIDAVSRALTPLRGFLARHATARDRETFTDLAAQMGRAARGDEVWVLAPAFVATELREAFAIAVLIFVPFLVIDLVVGLGLAALGLSATSPQVVALPCKLLLFVSVDGWRLLLDGLVRGYA
jgi:type III secretion protein R